MMSSDCVVCEVYMQYDVVLCDFCGSQNTFPWGRHFRKCREICLLGIMPGGLIESGSCI
jgi:hypothetical protein